MGALQRAVRWAMAPTRPAQPVSHETWPCPSCGRDVEIEAPPMALKQRGYWLPPSERELVAVCAATHGEHRRDGSPLVPPLPPDPEQRWRAVHHLDGGAFVVLGAPAPVGVRPRPDGRYEIVALDHLEASDLVGDPLARGRVVGTVEPGAVRFDPSGQLVDGEELGSTPSSIA